jgi:hypothetical protein
MVANLPIKQVYSAKAATIQSPLLLKTANPLAVLDGMQWPHYTTKSQGSPAIISKSYLLNTFEAGHVNVLKL